VLRERQPYAWARGRELAAGMAESAIAGAYADLDRRDPVSIARFLDRITPVVVEGALRADPALAPEAGGVVEIDPEIAEALTVSFRVEMYAMIHEAPTGPD